MSINSNRLTKRRIRTQRRTSGLTRTLTIIGVFAALAVSGLIYFLINRVQTDSLDELRIQARKEGIPLSTDDLFRMGLWQKPDVSSGVFAALLECMRSDPIAKAFVTSGIFTLDDEMKALSEGKPGERRSAARRVLKLEGALRNLIVKAESAAAFDAWIPGLSDRESPRDLLNLSRLSQALSAFALARASIGEWSFVERHLIAALKLARSLYLRPITMGHLIGTLALAFPYNALSVLERLDPAKTRAMRTVHDTMERPLANIEGRIRFLAHMARNYEETFGEQSGLRKFEKTTARISSDDMVRAEMAWLKAMIAVKAENSDGAPLASWLQSMAKHGPSADAESARIQAALTSQYPVPPAESGTGFFGMARKVLTPIEARAEELESSRREIYQNIWGNS